MIPFEHLEIGDGTASGTCILHDGVQYGVVSYAPTPPPRTPSALGGAGAHAIVVDPMTINIYGDSAANAVSNWDRLVAILDQAQRWYDNERVSVVRIRAQEQEGALGILEAIVVGPEPGTPPLSVAPAFNQTIGRWVIPGVEIKFRRNGQWLRPSESASSSASANPTIVTATFTSSASNPSPVSVHVDGFNSTTVAFIPDGFILIAKADNLAIVEGEAFTAAGVYSVVADAANNARGGSILRFTPATAFEVTISGASLPAAFDARVFAIYATIRCNTASTRWQVRVGFSTTSPIQYSYPVIIDQAVAGSNPKVVFLGIVNLRTDLFDYSGLTIGITPLHGASGTFDIDYLTFIGLEDETSTVIGFQEFQSIAMPVGGATDPEIAILSPFVEEYPEHLVAIAVPTAVSTQRKPLSWQGNASVYQEGTTISGIILMTGGTGLNYWRYSYGATPVSLSITARRRVAYMVPQ